MITDRHDFKIRYWGDDILRERCEPVTSFHEGIESICNKMVDIMYFLKAIGLAANQVGIPYQIIVLDTEYKLDKKRRPINKAPLILINPEIISASLDTVTQDEGCLSLPQQLIPVCRHSSINVKYFDTQGVEQSLEATGLQARCIQHEIDHLNGTLMVDKIDQSKVQLFKTNHLKILKNYKRR